MQLLHISTLHTSSGSLCKQRTRKHTPWQTYHLSFTDFHPPERLLTFSKAFSPFWGVFQAKLRSIKHCNTVTLKRAHYIVWQFLLNGQIILKWLFRLDGVNYLHLLMVTRRGYLPIINHPRLKFHMAKPWMGDAAIHCFGLNKSKLNLDALQRKHFYPTNPTCCGWERKHVIHLQLLFTTV